MTDKEKLDAIRAEIHRLVDVRGYDREMANDLFAFMNSLPNELVSEVWHDASKEPNDMSHCLIFYGDKNDVGHYLHYEPVLYNHQEKVFVTESFPHPTGYKVEQKSIDGGCVTEVYKNKRDRISISDITQWCYLKDLHNLSNVERTVKDWKEEPVSEDFEAALAEEWKGYNDRGAAKVDALEDNTQELAFAKGFYRGWHSKKEEPVSEELEKVVEEIVDPTVLNAYGVKEIANRLRRTMIA